MSNQEKTYVPPPIKGYRNLTQDEVDAINACKEAAEMMGMLCDKVKTLPGTDQRWADIGATDLQKGFMSLIRSIARPTTF